MELQGKRVRAVVVLFAAAVLSAALAVPAFAAGTWTTPDRPATNAGIAQDTFVTAAAHRQTESYTDMLGISNVTAVNGAAKGIGFAGEPATVWANMQKNAWMGVWGSNANEVPNPWIWNKFYNTAIEATGSTATEKNYRHVLMVTAGAGPGAADTTIVDEYGTSATLAMRPDIVLGYSGQGGDGYAPLVAEINTWKNGDPHWQPGDEGYDPKRVAFGGQPAQLATVDIMYNLAYAAKAVIDESDGAKQTRYDESAVQIARKWEVYGRASQDYVLAKIADGTVERKTIAFVRDVTDEGITFLDYGANNVSLNYRGPESLQAVADNIVSKNGYEADENGRYIGTAADAIDCDAIVIVTGNEDGGSSDGQTASDIVGNLQVALAAAGYTDQSQYPAIFTSGPSATCALSRAAADIMQNYGIYIGFVYPEVLSPVEMLAYFYENFYHIKSSALQSTMNNLAENMSLPAGVTLDLSGYSEKAVEAKFAEGIRYYVANKDAILAAHPELEFTEHVSLWSYVFTDTNPSAWYAVPECLDYVIDNEIMHGNDDGTFAPTKTITRGQVVTILHNLAIAAGSSTVDNTSGATFSDVNYNAYYGPAIRWAAANDVAHGSNGKFRPNDPVTREELATFIANYAEKVQGIDISGADDAAYNAMSDTASVTAYAVPALKWATDEGVIMGSNGKIQPKGSAQRAAAAAMVARFAQNIVFAA